jgi:hypothetical protein
MTEPPVRASEGLVADRIRRHAERLILVHLATEAPALATEPRPPSWAIWTCSTWSWRKRSESEKAAGSAMPSSSPGCRTT